MENVGNPLQQLFILALLQKQNEIEEAKNVLVNVMYLSYISEVTKFEIQRERLTFIDPTGLAYPDRRKKSKKRVKKNTSYDFDAGEKPRPGSGGSTTGSGHNTGSIFMPTFGGNYDNEWHLDLSDNTIGSMLSNLFMPPGLGGGGTTTHIPAHERREHSKEWREYYAAKRRQSIINAHRSKYPEKFAIELNPLAGQNYTDSLSGKISVKQVTPNIASNDPDMISTGGGTGDQYAGTNDSTKLNSEDTTIPIIYDIRNKDIDYFLDAIDQDGVYQIKAGVHSIILNVYTNDYERMFYATELAGSIGNPSNVAGRGSSAMSSFGFQGNKYKLPKYEGEFNDGEDFKNFFNRLVDDPTPVSIYNPIATSEDYNLQSVRDDMEARRLQWDEARPGYHGWLNLFGINCNTYANDIVTTSLGKGVWRNIKGLPGQNWKLWRPGYMPFSHNDPQLIREFLED